MPKELDLNAVRNKYFLGAHKSSIFYFLNKSATVDKMLCESPLDFAFSKFFVSKFMLTELIYRLRNLEMQSTHLILLTKLFLKRCSVKHGLSPIVEEGAAQIRNLKTSSTPPILELGS